ncbi:translocation/assembly module TamB domain-containing protein [Thioclava nitratireducens]|nr:translocation/assembly module TamB domain-containing protein [Thioclava nitratireducens]
MKRFAILLAFCLTPLMAAAQDNSPQAADGAGAATEQQTQRDRSYLTGLIEDNLSGAGRTVRLDGFSGALSSRATFDQLTISDKDGAWITIKDGAIQWNRSALLTGKIEIDELSAAEIDLPRLPTSQSSSTAPSPEAKPFQLPDLPVSVKIGKIDAQKVILGEPILGQEATVKVTGSMSLAGGEGKAKLDITRIDTKKGKFSLTASYDNGTRDLGLDLLVDEGKNGIIVQKIGLPGNPAMTLAVSGSGPLDDFTSDIVLSTDGQQRLAGQVSIGSKTPDGAPAGSPPVTTFSVALGGDIRPLLPPDYHEFFGNEVALVADGTRTASGQTTLSTLDLKSRALQLNGSAQIGATNMPVKFDLKADLGLGNGQEVLLPISGPKTYVQSGKLDLGYDKAEGDGWKLSGRLNQLRREDGTKMLTANLSGSGRIRQASPPSVGGTVLLGINGLELSDPKLSAAAGSAVTLRTVFSWQQDKPLRLSQLALKGTGYSLNSNLTIDNISEGITVEGAAQIDHSNLAMLSDLAGRKLGGSARMTVAGKYTVLSGAFDANLNLVGQDVSIDQPQADRALAGRSEIAISAKRDETGVTLDSLNVQTRAGTLQAQGTLASQDGKLTATLDTNDLSVLGGGYRGALAADATVTLNGERYGVTLKGTGKSLAIGQPEADKLLAGTTNLDLQASYANGAVEVQSLKLSNPQLDVSAKGTAGERSRKIDLNARLANAALFAPGFPGPVTVSGTVVDDGSGYQLNLSGTGPGGTDAKVSGRVASNFGDADLSITGQAQTALANSFIEPRSVQGPLSFDLRLNGKPGLSALSGTVSANGTKVVAPNLGMVLEDVNTQVQLSNGAAQLGLTGRLGTGGQITVNGPINLSAPYNGNLTIRFDRARLKDPELYDTRASGTITMDGPLAGGAKIAGRITLSDTELRVPSSGVGGGASVPAGIEHVGESGAVRQTLKRANLLNNGQSDASGGAKASGPSYPLDVTIASERGIFVRGRGLDAELGGSLRVSGTTSNVIPIGQFSLVRGRLDILGQRFTLDQGRIALQGALVPYIDFTATTTQNDYTISINIQGQANEPKVTFTSSPELPQDEVLARLIFGRSIDNLSPLQAAQLASAVATLAGKGGEGIIGKLRKNFGLDDFDVSTDAQGNTQLKVGKYLSDNIYTDVTVGGDGTSQINLNLDVTKSLTARGTVGSDGKSGIGLYFEKNY